MISGRLGLALAVFALVAWWVPSAVFGSLERLEVAEVEVPLDVIEQIELPSTPWPESEEESVHVAFLGDSMVISYPEGRRVPDRLQQRLDTLDHGQGRVRVHSVAAPGMGAFEYYFLADLIAAAEPDLVILPFNLGSLADAWRGTFARPQLSGFIEPARLPQAMGLPLDWVGVTTDRLLSFVIVVRSGGFEPWRQLSAQQARLGSARVLLARTLGSRFGNADERFSRESFLHLKNQMVVNETQRLTRSGVESRFGKALEGVRPDEPSLEVLAAAIHVFRGRGIPVLVYTNPTNVEHIASVIPSAPRGLALTLASIEVVAREAGARFVDLHDLLPNRGFRDFAGHLAVSGRVPDGPLHLAGKLAPVVVQSLAD